MTPQHRPPTVESVPESYVNTASHRSFLEDQADGSSTRELRNGTGYVGREATDSLGSSHVPRLPQKRLRAKSDAGVGDIKTAPATRLLRPRSDRSLRWNVVASPTSGLPRDSSSEPLNNSTFSFPASLGPWEVDNTRSGSSSGSNSTVTPVLYPHWEREGDQGACYPHHPQPFAVPDAFSFLDPDSPVITEESIQRTVAEASARWRDQDPSTASPRSASSASSASSAGPYGLGSDASSEQDTEPSTSPEQSVNGDTGSTTTAQTTPVQECVSPVRSSKGYSRSRTHRNLSETQAEKNAHRYGTPEMPRGNANLPHLPPNALTPRVSNPGQGYVNHLPRAEKLPLTGYELLAARLTSHPHPRRARGRRTRVAPYSDGESGESTGSGESAQADPISYSHHAVDRDAAEEPNLPPIYRRFEGLNHRLLLHLQDELSELEEQLHRLDTADTQTRRLRDCILPASRRAEYMAAGELQWHKTDILGKIGFKMGQYNQALSSFTATQDLPSPSTSDVHTYRTYLNTHNPIAENETRFLDPAEDLVSLAPRRPRRPQNSSVDADMGHARGRHCSALSDENIPTLGRNNYTPYSVSPFSAGGPGGHRRPAPLSSSSHPHDHEARRQPSTRSSSSGSSGTTTTATVTTTTTAARPSLLSLDAAEAAEERKEEGKEHEKREPGPALRPPYLVAAILAAVMMPILASRVVQSLVARVALVVITALVAGLGHCKVVEESLGTRDMLTCAGVYGVVMAVVLYETF